MSIFWFVSNPVSINQSTTNFAVKWYLNVVGAFFTALSLKRGLVRIHPKVDIWYMIKISASYNLLWIQFNQFSVQSFQKSGAGPNEKIGLKKKTRSLETKDLNLIHICEAFFYQH